MAEKIKRPDPKEGQIYKHFKGALYEIVAIAVHTESSEKLVVYRSLEKSERVFARPLDMFMSEVDRFRYPFVKAKYRFTLEAEVAEANSIEEQDGTLALDPVVEAILDEKDFTKKIENYELLRGKCTDEMLTTLAISLDVQLSGESIDEKYAEILKTLRMHEKYESARFR